MARVPTMRRQQRDSFVRFVLPRMNPDTGTADGIFDVAHALQHEDGLSGDEYAELRRLLRWFGDHLPVPTRFNRTKSKGYYRRKTKGISWLKDSADRHVAQMHRLAEILKRHGHEVTMIKTNRPGYVVYEDEYQIVAEPFYELKR